MRAHHNESPYSAANLLRAQDSAAAKRAAAVKRAAKRKRPEYRRFQLAFLRAIRESGQASSDDAQTDLDEVNAVGAANYVGAAINCLAEAGLVFRDGETKSKRASRRGSRIGLWRSADDRAVAARIAELQGELEDMQLADDDSPADVSEWLD